MIVCRERRDCGYASTEEASGVSGEEAGWPVGGNKGRVASGIGSGGVRGGWSGGGSFA